MKPFVAVPCYRDAPMISATCISALIKRGYQTGFVIGCPYMGRAVNQLSRDFLDTDCTHMFRLDCDIVFNEENIDRILSHDVPIIGGSYYKKQLERQIVCNALPDVKPEDVTDSNGVMQVMYVGFGFSLIAREVFEKMREVLGKEITYRDDATRRIEWDFWPVGIHQKSGRWLSEDWWFCHRAAELGYKVYLDTKCLVGHIGQIIFPL